MAYALVVCKPIKSSFFLERYTKMTNVISKHTNVSKVSYYAPRSIKQVQSQSVFVPKSHVLAHLVRMIKLDN